MIPQCPIDQTPCLACGNTCMKKRIAELESQVFVPGQWRCAKCNFTVQKMTLDLAGDRVGVSDKDKNEPEKCPNGCGPLWRVTERDAGNRAIEGYESILSEIMKALDVTNYPAIVPAISALRQPQASSAERIRELESENKALREEIECLETEAEMAEEQLENAALRQGALTEGDRERLAQIKDWYEGVRPADFEYSHIYELFDIIDRLTAAPASQVTREEIEQCIRSNVWVAVDETPCGIDEATDVIMSLLASRGLVKEG